ncbi:hypothetical protein ACJIZ3_022375 [Penstemon smallii]|uniref:Uncharacterized protein n=1 Tax=Penstemon smallii TaxID=265156 RepID=A0ABD3TL42_9LAMI
MNDIPITFTVLSMALENNTTLRKEHVGGKQMMDTIRLKWEHLVLISTNRLDDLLEEALMFVAHQHHFPRRMPLPNPMHLNFSRASEFCREGSGGGCVIKCRHSWHMRLS